MKEIRLHGRGGQGAVLASELLVWAATAEGQCSNAVPFFGFERRGAPVAAFVRLDDQRIREKTQIYEPDCVVVMDGTLRQSVDLFQGLKQGGVVVWNGTRPPGELSVPAMVGRLGVVDATRIALEVLDSPIGIPITNTAMLGALAATTGWITLEAILAAVRGRMRPDIAEKNVRAAQTAFERTVVVDLAPAGTSR